METIKEKVIVFGSGSTAQKALCFWDEEYTDIVAIVDNNSKRQGEKFAGKIIVSPEQINKLQFDKVVICSIFFESIKKQLIQNFKIEENDIYNRYYFLKLKILNKKINVIPDNIEIKEIKKFWMENGFGVYNGNFIKKYNHIKLKIFYDKEKALYYVFHQGKKMFFSKKLDTYEKVHDYYKFLLMEQDEKSPHRYLRDEIGSMKNKVVIDAGVAEGNFGLEIIEEVKQLIIIEADLDWIEALQYTFEPYKEKVTFYQKYLCDKTEQDKLCIDDIKEIEKVDYIKMDIEGAEISAVLGAKKAMIKNSKLKMLICCYHNKEDESQLREILEKRKFKITATEGYMIYLDENWHNMKSVEMTRGVLYASR